MHLILKNDKLSFFDIEISHLINKITISIFCKATFSGIFTFHILHIQKLKFWKKVWILLLFKKKLNEPELRSDFDEFCTRMRLKWHFQHESENFSEVPVLTQKLSGNHLKVILVLKFP